MNGQSFGLNTMNVSIVSVLANGGEARTAITPRQMEGRGQESERMGAVIERCSVGRVLADVRTQRPFATRHRVHCPRVTSLQVA